jgi:hypothetical protein
LKNRSLSPEREATVASNKLAGGDDPADFSHLKVKRKVPLTIANLVSHE